MRSAIYLGQKTIEVREVPLPEIGDNDVLIQNIYSSICGTDVAVYIHGPNTGHKVTVGGEFGHETISKSGEFFRQIKTVIPYIKPDNSILKYAVTLQETKKPHGITLCGFFIILLNYDAGSKVPYTCEKSLLYIM